MFPFYIIKVKFTSKTAENVMEMHQMSIFLWVAVWAEARNRRPDNTNDFFSKYAASHQCLRDVQQNPWLSPFSFHLRLFSAAGRRVTWPHVHASPTTVSEIPKPSPTYHCVPGGQPACLMWLQNKTPEPRLSDTIEEEHKETEHVPCRKRTGDGDFCLLKAPREGGGEQKDQVGWVAEWERDKHRKWDDMGEIFKDHPWKTN